VNPTLAEKTILVVDDEHAVRESLREVLSDEGYRVVDTGDCSTVLQLIDSNKPGLVLLDIWMPQADGIELLKVIKSREPELNVVMISGHGNIHTAVTATKFGAFDFIEKPLSIEGLLLTVRRALGQATPSADNGAADQTRSAKVERRAATRKGSARAALRQRTLKKSVVTSGQGLHSGIKTGLVLHPLPAHSGILFTGISADASVRAHLDNVASTGYATSLRNRGFSVATVEHFLAALHGHGISNLLVKVQSEVPILDGSAIEFCQLIEEAGIDEQHEESTEIVIDRPYSVTLKGGESIAIEPAEHFSVRYLLRYPKPIGQQEYYYLHQGADSFKAEIAPARTFGFLKDIAQLQKMGLANGGRLGNFILIDDEKIVNTELRFPEELARHKILDILGDFYLLGHPIRGAITACMTGHSDNIALLREIQTGMGL
jgi:UDP-3-O-[3-hydroxymyristoyl] N-acetylglucosamine deacetylase